MSLHGSTTPPTIFVIACASTEQADICALILQVRVVDLVQLGSRDVLLVYPSALTNAATYLTLANGAAAQDSDSGQYPIPFGCRRSSARLAPGTESRNASRCSRLYPWLLQKEALLARQFLSVLWSGSSWARSDVPMASLGLYDGPE
jgi:hypothetical protein